MIDYPALPFISPLIRGIMTEAGYEPIHTGGGCWAWHKPMPGDENTFLTIISEDMGLNDDPGAEVWLAGRYSAIDCGSIDYREAVTLEQAISIAPRLPSPIQADEKEVQKTIGPDDLA